MSQFIEKNKPAILLIFAVVFVCMSFTGTFTGNATSAAIYAACAIVLLLLVFPGSIEYFKLGSTVEVKLREVRETLNEAKELSRLIAEIAVPLAHKSEGMAGGAPSTVKVKSLVLTRVGELMEKLEVPLSRDIEELDYYSTCADYVHAIQGVFDQIEQSRIYRKMKCHSIAASIHDVETPESLGCGLNCTTS